MTNVARKSRDWTGVIDDTENATALNGLATSQILVIAAGEVEVTVTRIVGTVALYPQDFADIGMITAGIAVVPTQNNVPLAANPQNVSDLSNSYWLWTRFIASTGSQNATTNSNRAGFDVDIKVMRKLRAGEALILQSSNNLTAGHHSFFALRMLLLK